MTDLLEAIFKCDHRKLKNFIGDGRNVNCKIPGTEGCTILHIIAGTKKSKRYKDEIISYLLDIGGDPNCRSDDDLTPVHIAAMWNNSFELDKLLQVGGNPWLLDSLQKNAFDLAADNDAYEAYQLLNQYLADNKLDFRTKDITSKTQAIDLTNEQQIDKINESFNSLQLQNDTINSFFCTANENFPLNFTSTEDESKSFILGVNEIVKKNSYKVYKKENDIKEYQTFTDNSQSDLWPDTNSSIFNNAIMLSNNNELYNKGTETIIESDDVSGVVLVEKPSFSNPFLPNLKCPSYNSLIVNDWKSFRFDTSNSSSDCSSFASEIIIPKQFYKLSNSKIFQELIDLGDKPGPVNDFTREVYLKRLTKLKSGCHVSSLLPEPKFCPEMYQFLNNKISIDKLQAHIDIMSEEFNDSKLKSKWREGSKKSCFNYFLLDPRVTQNLPARQASLKFEQKFQIFIDAIFYVGKGTKGRPYSHLLDAVKTLVDLHTKTDKINHILDIWNSGYGVISLHCFHNCIPVEAYTQEACIIEALGLKNLTNIRSGDYYGLAAKWPRSQKRKIGILLLNRAFQIFLHEGEKQIKPKDLTKN